MSTHNNTYKIITCEKVILQFWLRFEKRLDFTVRLRFGFCVCEWFWHHEFGLGKTWLSIVLIVLKCELNSFACTNNVFTSTVRFWWRFHTTSTGRKVSPTLASSEIILCKYYPYSTLASWRCTEYVQSMLCLVLSFVSWPLNFPIVIFLVLSCAPLCPMSSLVHCLILFTRCVLSSH